MRYGRQGTYKVACTPLPHFLLALLRWGPTADQLTVKVPSHRTIALPLFVLLPPCCWPLARLLAAHRLPACLLLLLLLLPRLPVALSPFVIPTFALAVPSSCPLPRSFLVIECEEPCCHSTQALSWALHSFGGLYRLVDRHGIGLAASWLWLWLWLCSSQPSHLLSLVQPHCQHFQIRPPSTRSNGRRRAYGIIRTAFSFLLVLVLLPSRPPLSATSLRSPATLIRATIVFHSVPLSVCQPGPFICSPPGHTLTRLKV